MSFLHKGNLVPQTYPQHQRNQTFSIKAQAINSMHPPKQLNMYTLSLDSSDTIGIFFQEICQDGKAINTINSPESKIWMDTSTPYNLLDIKGISYTRTYAVLSGSNKMIHSQHRYIRWYMWSTALTRTWWNTISNSLSLTYIHGHTEKMKYY